MACAGAGLRGRARRLPIRDWPRCLEVLAGAWRRGTGRRAARGRSPDSCWPPCGSRGRTAAYPSPSRAPGGEAGAWLPGIGPTGTAGRGSRESSAGGSTPGAGPDPGPGRTRLRPCPPGRRRTGCWRSSAPTGSPTGDFLAVDHRDPRSPCRFELRGAGRTWLGPEWGDGMNGPDGSASRPRPVRWLTGSMADLIEWTDRRDGVRTTRSALLLRGRRLALISTLAERRGATWDADPMLRLTTPAGRRGRADQGVPRPGPRRTGSSRRGARPADRPALPARIPPTGGRSGPWSTSSSCGSRRPAGGAGSPCSSPGTRSGTASP